MTDVVNTAKLGLFIPALLNPVTLAAVGIRLGLMWLLRDDEEATVEDVPIKPIKLEVKTAAQPFSRSKPIG
jgi:hypothetical protein